MSGAKPDLLRPANQFVTQVLDKFYPDESKQIYGFKTPWKKCEILCFPPGELSLWSGVNGHGKSLILNQLLLQAAKAGEKTAIASFEMKAERTLYRAVRQATGLREPSINVIVECLDWLADHLLIYDQIGKGDRSAMLSRFAKAVDEDGVTQFVIDSLMKVGIAQDDYNTLADFVDRLQHFAQVKNVHVHLVAHSRKTGDEGDVPGKFDVKGPMEITNLPDNVFSVWRNKKKEEEVEAYQTIGDLPRGLSAIELYEKYDAVLECSKSREFGSDAEKQYGLYYHADSMQYLEKRDASPFMYFDWRGL